MTKTETANQNPGSQAAKEGARVASAGAQQLQAIADQMAGLERQALDRMKTTVHDAARLTADALDYAIALSAHWRTFAIDAVKRAADAPTP